MMSKLKHISTLSTPADVEKRRFNVRLQLWVDLVCLMSTDEMSLQQYFYKKWTSCVDCHVACHFFSSCRCKFSIHIYLQMWSSGDKSGWYVSFKVTLTKCSLYFRKLYCTFVKKIYWFNTSLILFERDLILIYSIMVLHTK